MATSVIRTQQAPAATAETSAKDAVGEVTRYYQGLLTSLRVPARGSSVPRVVGVSSCQRGEGASTVAVNLAVAAAASLEEPVLLIDAHFAAPSVEQRFDLKPGPGLSEVLLRKVPEQSAIRPSKLPGLHLLPAGSAELSRAACADPAALAKLLEQLRQRYSLILIDLPPADLSSGTVSLASLLDGVLLVLQTGRVSREIARLTRDRLNKAGAHLLGVVLNQT